jgi:hypothetical protein
MVFVAVLCGVALLMAFTTPSGGSGEDDAVHGVAVVHHSDPGGIPRGSNTKKMLASYYGRTLEGHPMANGQPFDADAYTAAHKSLPFGTELVVSHGDESVRVTCHGQGALRGRPRPRPVAGRCAGYRDYWYGGSTRAGGRSLEGLQASGILWDQTSRGRRTEFLPFVIPAEAGIHG